MSPLRRVEQLTSAKCVATSATYRPCGAECRPSACLMALIVRALLPPKLLFISVE